MASCFIKGVIFCFIFPIIGATIQCMDKKGKPVDWFIEYKLPKIADHPEKLVQEGVGHYYLDVNQLQFEFSDVGINETGHAVWHTLQQIYNDDNKQETFYAMYNDQPPPPKNVSFTHGHTKGDLAFDEQTGFWLVHSVPHFPPPADEGYGYPHSGRPNGQSFLCVSFRTKELENIAKQLLYNYPLVYAHNLPATFRAVSPSLPDVVAGRHIKQAPWFRITNLTSIRGMPFTSFAKFTTFNADLYDSLVAPTFQMALLTETWQNGRGKLSSNCTAKYPVMNVQQMTINDTKITTTFSETHDHSKWAVTGNVDIYGQRHDTWICIGDINRANTQFERAGGTLCMQQVDTWMQFAQDITDAEYCAGTLKPATPIRQVTPSKDWRKNTDHSLKSANSIFKHL